SKNLLAVIQSITAQTARSGGTIEEFQTRLVQRLHGIAISHDLIVDENWERVKLDELVIRQLQAFVEPGERLRVEGPTVFLSPAAAQNIGFALHELTTNAAKYDALSSAKGVVNISWELEGVGCDRQLKLCWREAHGPRVMRPSRMG